MCSVIQVERLALQFGSGLLRLDLVPLLDVADPLLSLPPLRCLAIFAKNREEWIIAEEACTLLGWASYPCVYWRWLGKGDVCQY